MFLLALSCHRTTPPPPPVAPAPDRAREAAAFVTEVDAKLLELWRAADQAHWRHETDITDEHEALAAAADERTMAFLATAIHRAAAFRGVELDPQTARELHLLKLASPLPAPDDPAKRAELAAIATRMSSAYGKAEWCPG